MIGWHSTRDSGGRAVSRTLDPTYRFSVAGPCGRSIHALRQRFASDGCSHATRGVAYALTQPSVRRQSTRSTRSGRFTRFWLVWPLRQTGPTLSFDAFAPAAWLLLHLFVYPKLTHAPVRRLVWLVRHTETVHLHSDFFYSE